MRQSIIFFIGLRFLNGRYIDYFNKFMSWSASIGVGISIFSFVLILSIMNGLKKELEKNILTFIPQVLITSDKESIKPKINHITHFLKNSNVIDATTVVVSDIIIQNKIHIIHGTMLGIQPHVQDPISPYIIETKQKKLKNGTYRIILGQALAKKLNVRIGENVRLIVPNMKKDDIITNFLNQKLFNVIGFFFTNTEVDNYQVLINQEDACEIMDYPKGEVTGWRLWLKNPLNIMNFQYKNLIPKNMLWKDWREKKGELFQAIEMEKKMMSLLLIFMLIISTFNIITSLVLLIFEKKGEIAILMTYGMSKYKIIKIFILQSMILGMLGIFFGIFFGLLISSQINNILFFNVIFPVSFSIVQILKISILTMTIIFITTLYPAYYASRLNPSETLSYE